MENPEILWAQNRDKIFITINVSDISEQNIKMTADLIHFEGKNKNKEYNVEINLLKTIEPEESTWTVKPNSVNFTLKKLPEIFWSKLTSVKFNNIRVDWNKCDIMEDSDEDSDDMTYEQENLFNNFKDFTKTLPSDLMEKDFQELFPQNLSEDITNEDISDENISNEDISDYNEENSIKFENISNENLNIENLNISKLNEEIILKMEEGRITRKDRESLSTNEDDDQSDKIEEMENGILDNVIPETE